MSARVTLLVGMARRRLKTASMSAFDGFDDSAILFLFASRSQDLGQWARRQQETSEGRLSSCRSPAPSSDVTLARCVRRTRMRSTRILALHVIDEPVPRVRSNTADDRKRNHRRCNQSPDSQPNPFLHSLFASVTRPQPFFGVRF